MATEDKRRQFDDIVAHLITDYPSLARRGRQRAWTRSVRVTGLVLAAIAWGLLSVSMVAWGWKGVVLTCAVVVGTAITIAVDHFRRN